MAQGVSRNEVLNNFIFSPEFIAYVEGIFGMSTVRPENNLVNDFYRGILSRLPDTVGFNYWLGQMRAAQCAGSAQQIRDLVSPDSVGIYPEYGVYSEGKDERSVCGRPLRCRPSSCRGADWARLLAELSQHAYEGAGASGIYGFH